MFVAGAHSVYVIRVITVRKVKWY